MDFSNPIFFPHSRSVKQLWKQNAISLVSIPTKRERTNLLKIDLEQSMCKCLCSLFEEFIAKKILKITDLYCNQR